MAFAKFIVFASLCYTVGATSIPLGYLAMNMSIRPSCYAMPSNRRCSSIVNYQVVDVTAKLNLVKKNMHAVYLDLKSVDFFQGNSSCRDAVLEYSCSNNVMKCVTRPKSYWGVHLSYDITRTETACEKVLKSCPSQIGNATVHNCSVIQRNPFDFAVCEKHTPFPQDPCPSSGYTHPKAITKFYEIQAKSFSNMLSLYKHALISPSCKTEFLGMYCQILRGPICSVGNMRMFKSTRQDCEVVVNKCVTGLFIQNYFRETCKFLPENTAARIPLPLITNSGAGGNAAGGNGGNGGNAGGGNTGGNTSNGK